MAQAQADLPEILTVDDLMRVFRRSREWVRDLLNGEKGPPCIREGRTLLVRREDFRKWAANRAKEQA